MEYAFNLSTGVDLSEFETRLVYQSKFQNNQGCVIHRNPVGKERF